MVEDRDLRIQAVFYNNPDLYPPIINSARLLARKGFALELFCRENDEQWEVEYPPQVQVLRIDSHAGSSWCEYLEFVVQVLRRASGKAALFVGHDMHGLLPARLLAARHRRPLVYHCHDFAESGRRLPLGSQIVRIFERAFARTADLVIVPDEERGRVVARELHLRQASLIVPNAPLSAPKSSDEALSAALAAQGKRFGRIVFRQGRIGVGHAIESTLRSMPLWKGSDWGFVLMGIGDSDYCESLERLAHELEVEGRFVVLPPVGYDQVAQFTIGAHVGHGLYEPIHINNLHITTASCKIMEYMAAGLPLLVSDRPGLKALIETYGCGLVADERSPESIATAVNALLGDPDRARRMGQAAAHAFEKEFNYERQFAPALDAFRDLAARPHR